MIVIVRLSWRLTDAMNISLAACFILNSGLQRVKWNGLLVKYLRLVVEHVIIFENSICINNVPTIRSPDFSQNTIICENE